MPQIDFVLLLLIIGSSGFLWLALFIVSRATTQTTLTILSFVAMASTAIFFGSSLLIENSQGKEADILLVRGFWWSDVLPIAFWYHLSAAITNRKGKTTLFPPSVVIVYTLGLVVTFLGTFTDLILNYSGMFSVGSNDHWIVPLAPTYWIFGLFLALTMLGAVVNIGLGLMKWSSSSEPGKEGLLRQLWLALMGGTLFLAGGLWIVVALQFFGGTSRELGYLFLICGISLYGYAVAQYGMLLEGKNVQRDFVYSFSGIFIIDLLYALVLGISQTATPHNLLAVVGLATITHTAIDWGRGLLDKFFFSTAEQEARAEARAYATSLASQPTESPVIAASLPEISLSIEKTEELKAIQNGTTLDVTIPVEDESAQEKSFKDTVRRAITGLKSPPQLANSPLLTLRIVGKRLQEMGLEREDNRLNRAAALKNLLIELIERLRPDDSASFGTTEGWRYFNVLYFPYVREISKKQAFGEARRLADERRRNGVREVGDVEKVLEWLSDVDENTFYKWQRRASDTIAEILREEEARLHKGKQLAVFTSEDRG